SSPLLFLIAVFLFHEARLLHAQLRAAGHSQTGEISAHQVFHHAQFAADAHAADGFHDVAGRFELLEKLTDSAGLAAGAAGDSPTAVAVDAVGLEALLFGHRIINGAHLAHLA